MNSMHLCTSQDTPLYSELDLIAELLPINGSQVLELGCGNAAKTQAIARRFEPACIEAAEVDGLAQAANRKAQPSWDVAENIRLVDYGAEAIEKPDASVDLVLMFKSLHHVPSDCLDKAMGEIRRVLKPGGLAYISEPVFAGDLNEVIRLFHDEERVRTAAFAALCHAVEDGQLELVEQRFFRAPVQFESFSQFANGIIHATHSSHQLSPALLAEVEARFDDFFQSNQGRFETPNRVDLLRRPL